MEFIRSCKDDIFREFALVCEYEKEINNEIIKDPIIVSYNDYNINNLEIKDITDNTIIEVINMDTLDCVHHLIENLKVKQNDICILNMGNSHMPGAGMVSMNFVTQEEEILRRCDFFKHLPLSLYPIKKDQLILTRDVSIKRDKNYNYYSDERIYNTNIITSCALFNPIILDNKFLYEADREITYKKIDLIFKTAYMYKYKYLILSAYGCGAFMNPQYEIINIFNELLYKYNNKFEMIIFAIYDNDLRGNYMLFKDNIIS